MNLPTFSVRKRSPIWAFLFVCLSIFCSAQLSAQSTSGVYTEAGDISNFVVVGDNGNGTSAVSLMNENGDMLAPINMSNSLLPGFLTDALGPDYVHDVSIFISDTGDNGVQMDFPSPSTTDVDVTFSVAEFAGEEWFVGHIADQTFGDFFDWASSESNFDAFVAGLDSLFDNNGAPSELSLFNLNDLFESPNDVFETDIYFNFE